MDLDHERRLTAVEKLAETQADRLDDVERRQDDLDKLVSSVASMATKQEYMESDVKEIKADVKTLTEKPGKRWDGIVDNILWAVLAAVIAFALGRFGL